MEQCLSKDRLLFEKYRLGVLYFIGKYIWSYSTVFGVKYHAELAPIERKWMFLKQRIRRELNGKLCHLIDLVHREFTRYTVVDAQKACRHCRDTMAAYMALGQQEATLASLRDEEKKMKGHRRVFDSCDNMLKLKAEMVLTTREKATAQKVAEQRETISIHQQLDDRHAIEKKQYAARQARAKRPNDKVRKDKVGNKERKKKMLEFGQACKQLTLKQMCDKLLNT